MNELFQRWFPQWPFALRDSRLQNIRADTALYASSHPIPEFDVAADHVSASRAGGDFHDVFARPNGACSFVLGTASGSGIPGGVLKRLIRIKARSQGWTESPTQHELATSRFNQLLCDRASRAHDVAMFWSYFDPANQLLRYVNAGHRAPLVFKSDRRKTLLRLSRGGPVLGLLPQLRYQQGAVRLDPGDVLILFSAGVIDATSPDGETWGEDRLQALVAHCAHLTAEQVRWRIVSSISEFTRHAAPDEDRTVVVIRYTRGRKVEAQPRLEKKEAIESLCA
jgi:sigma-B regulation protein RsbU (phosphoserine phosphatase)